uniref:phage repressor protein CI n=1 Tax=Hafnia alvei TaxID=569 RepID=UPI00266DAEF4|nr:phage repressor protein CI [Hafnia alvei]
MDFNNGGKKAIERLVEAYGFTTRQALCDHLGVSKSTMATRYMRDIFPADWVLQCAMETGLSIQWLSFGEGPKKDVSKLDTVSLPKKNLISGKLVDAGFYIFDNAFLPVELQDPLVITEQNSDFICDTKFDDVSDGKWVVGIDGKIAIRELTRLPRSRIFVEGGNSAFECRIDEISIIGKVRSTTEKYVD